MIRLPQIGVPSYGTPVRWELFENDVQPVSSQRETGF